MGLEMETGKHFVLVHGSCHGAWCWYKLVPLLKSAGHEVTALDLAASGINSMQLDDIDSFSDYIQPLLEFMSNLPQDEKVILVGHSYGGFSISLAMQKFPKKILVAVFVTADMPNCISPPASVMEEFSKWHPEESQLDCKFVYANGLQSPPTSTSFGPAYLETILYRDCSSEDLELAKLLARPQGIFYEDLAKESVLTEGEFGLVNRVFVVCDKDGVMPEEMQRWMIENNPPKEVKCISGAGHMVMLSMPKQLCHCLLEIASTYQ